MYVYIAKVTENHVPDVNSNTECLRCKDKAQTRVYVFAAGYTCRSGIAFCLRHRGLTTTVGWYRVLP